MSVKKKQDPGLPIPDVLAVREVRAPSVHSFAIIAPDYMAGRKHRYSVIRVMRETGVAYTIGRELRLDLARIVADWMPADDGKPVENYKPRKRR